MSLSGIDSLDQKNGPLAQELIGKIESNSACIGVVGLGYVGLPLVELFCQQQFRVIGFDIDQTKVDLLNAGESYIGHIPSESVAALLSDHHFEATVKFDLLSQVDAIVICVPTPLTRHREPDLTAIISTAEVISQHLRAGQLSR